MRLIILDSDKNYLQSIRVVLSSQMKEYIEVFTVSTLKDLLELDQFIGLESYLLIHESFIEELMSNEVYLEMCQRSYLGLLSEGIIKVTEYTKILKGINSSCHNHDIENSIYMKYQPIRLLLSAIKDNYLKSSTSKLVLGQRDTHLISLYRPYGSIEFSRWIESTLKSFPAQYKILLIHYDPFYKSKDKSKFNLSYIFSLLKRGKKDISFAINEIKEVLAYNVDVFNGPGNMLDIDCLSEEELLTYIENLKNLIDYDIVLLNFNGVHISQHIIELLGASNECVLCHEEEDVQLSITRQTNVTWTLMMNDLKNVLQEVILNNDNGK